MDSSSFGLPQYEGGKRGENDDPYHLKRPKNDFLSDLARQSMDVDPVEPDSPSLFSSEKKQSASAAVFSFGDNKKPRTDFGPSFVSPGQMKTPAKPPATPESKMTCEYESARKEAEVARKEAESTVNEGKKMDLLTEQSRNVTEQSRNVTEQSRNVTETTINAGKFLTSPLMMKMMQEQPAAFNMICKNIFGESEQTNTEPQGTRTPAKKQAPPENPATAHLHRCKFIIGGYLPTSTFFNNGYPSALQVLQAIDGDIGFWKVSSNKVLAQCHETGTYISQACANYRCNGTAKKPGCPVKMRVSKATGHKFVVLHVGDMEHCQECVYRRPGQENHLKIKPQYVNKPVE